VKRTLTAHKGHGTENDFVVLPDLEAVISLSPSMVRALCDRHAGIGADGVLRVVRTALATEPDVREQAEQAEFFMDYHNRDGSIAEMCGNGVRVFGRYLQQAGLIGEAATVATRGGPKTLVIEGTQISVDMGSAVIRRERPIVSVNGVPGEFDSIALDLPNPHVVVQLSSVADLEALDLSRPPSVSPALPEGQNVEFVVRTGANRLQMRVHERGAGETRSCGTGICAAVAAAAGDKAGSGEWLVQVPGGQCGVWWNELGHLVLSGPAVLVGSFELREDWLASHR
jgi:diaminopimelate epimerase